MGRFKTNEERLAKKLAKKEAAKQTLRKLREPESAKKDS